MAGIINEPTRDIYDPSDLNSQVREYVRLKESIEALDKRSKELREQLMQTIDEDGLEDNKGNLLYELDEAVDGVIRIEKQRRATRKLDELKAEEIIESKNLSDKVYKTIRVLDEDALMAAHYEGELTEEEIDEMFPVTVVWALRTAKK